VKSSEERDRARILVVEDIEEEARLITAILERAGYETSLATTVPEALAAIAEGSFDLVATDLVIPGKGGVELVMELRKRYPQVPVIVVTAHGDGAATAQALRRGASSYVPKAQVLQELVRTVDSVLAVALEERDRNHVLLRMTEFHLVFELENEQNLVGPLVRFLQEAVSAVEPEASETQLTHLGMALQEAIVNAMIHGNLEVSSSARADGGEEWNRLIAERQKSPAYGARRVHLDFRLHNGRVTCAVEDEGPGFDVSAVPDPTDSENLLKGSGRGLFLIGAFMDEVRHNESGNRITLSKNLVVEPRLTVAR
jgi:CheY-like chemotaxis protein